MTTERLQHFGDWTVGDTLKTLEYACLNADNTAFDLTGRTAKLQGRSVDNSTNKVDQAATITTPANGKITVAPVLVISATKSRELYECQFEITRTSDSKVTFTDPFTIAIRKRSL